MKIKNKLGCLLFGHRWQLKLEQSKWICPDCCKQSSSVDFKDMLEQREKAVRNKPELWKNK